MQFTLSIDCDNAAFGGDPVPEIVHLLEILTTKLQHGSTEGSLLDTNGNRVATYELVGDTDEPAYKHQDEAEIIAKHDESLFLLGSEGDELGLEDAFREHVQTFRLDIDPDDVDYAALATFLENLKTELPED